MDRIPQNPPIPSTGQFYYGPDPHGYPANIFKPPPPPTEHARMAHTEASNYFPQMSNTLNEFNFAAEQPARLPNRGLTTAQLKEGPEGVEEIVAQYNTRPQTFAQTKSVAEKETFPSRQTKQETRTPLPTQWATVKTSNNHPGFLSLPPSSTNEAQQPAIPAKSSAQSLQYSAASAYLARLFASTEEGQQAAARGENLIQRFETNRIPVHNRTQNVAPSIQVDAQQEIAQPKTPTQEFLEFEANSIQVHNTPQNAALSVQIEAPLKCEPAKQYEPTMKKNNFNEMVLPSTSKTSNHDHQELSTNERILTLIERFEEGRSCLRAQIDRTVAEGRELDLDEKREPTRVDLIIRVFVPDF